MNRTLPRIAASTLFLLLACGPEDSARDSSSSSTTLLVDASTTEPNPDPPSRPGHGGTPCQLDADCDAGMFCELRICVVGCTDATPCDVGELCDPHGRCTAGADEKPPLTCLPALAERRTTLEPSEKSARTTLRNDGQHDLTYRLAAKNTALTVDAAPARLAPGAEVELVAAVDLDALGPDDHVLLVQIITSGGGILWSIEPAAAPEPGYSRGAVRFAADEYGLGSSDLALDLDFRPDGTIAGRVDTDASLLWPLPPAVTGMWTAAGDISIELRDFLPAENWRHSPIARELGRVLTLTGTRTAAGIEGTATETITGLRAAPVELQGMFTLRPHGRSPASSTPPTSSPRAPRRRPGSRRRASTPTHAAASAPSTAPT